jgi:toxin ParE1/3/4
LDIEGAVDWYRDQADVDTGLRFVDAVEAGLRHLSGHPGTGSPRYAAELDLPGLRSWPLDRFPYIVFYVEQLGHLDVWRVLHAQRDIPGWLRDPDHQLEEDGVGARNPIVASGGVPILVDQAVASGETDELRGR